ncbi:hypothetical protein CGRA01v4_01722 [Colletotrichum graminicola]|nr:hypothetical protein CGRA01v4_01722 [Colletotrichum graminicola]
MILSKAILILVTLLVTNVFAEKILLAAFYHSGNNVFQAEKYVKVKSSQLSRVVDSFVSAGQYDVSNSKKGWKIGTKQIFHSEAQAEAEVARMETRVG